jgi:single-stranded-DNA-specific exonuclease
MQRKWRIAAHDTGHADSLRRAAELPTIVASLLIGRGIDNPAAAEAFLNPKLTDLRDPSELPDIDRAVPLIAETIATDKRIVIHGDYDADGITGTAILFRCIKLLGGNVGYYIPNRLQDGYGLKDAAIERFAAEGTSLVITVDCGIASVTEAETIKQLGMQLIVTDHHQLGDAIPQAAAIIHPGLPGHPYPFAGLSGAGVAFKLAWALCQNKSGGKRVTPQLKNFLLQAVGLAAIGTVADMVPLLDENRALVYHGLGSLLQRPVPGLTEMMKITKLDQKKYLGSEDIGFTIAPRLNAAGRLGQATLAVELLTSDDVSRSSSLADYLHQLNKSRESLERSVFLGANKQALEAIDSGSEGALVLGARGWHAGVIGIVAGRLVEKFHRPVLLVALDEMDIKPGLGSARSVPGFNIAKGLAVCRENLISHGGHAAAAGFQIDPQKLDSFRSEFCEYACEHIQKEDRHAELAIDAEVPFSGLTLQAVQQIERLQPFGQGNQRPLFCSSQIELASAPKTIGGGGRHLAMELIQHGVRLRGVAFGRGHWAADLANVEGSLSLAYRPVINSFRGRQNVELHIEDWQDQTGGAISNTAESMSRVG